MAGRCIWGFKGSFAVEFQFVAFIGLRQSFSPLEVLFELGQDADALRIFVKQ